LNPTIKFTSWRESASQQKRTAQVAVLAQIRMLFNIAKIENSKMSCT